MIPARPPGLSPLTAAEAATSRPQFAPLAPRPPKSPLNSLRRAQQRQQARLRRGKRRLKARKAAAERPPADRGLAALTGAVRPERRLPPRLPAAGGGFRPTSLLPPASGGRVVKRRRVERELKEVRIREAAKRHAWRGFGAFSDHFSKSPTSLRVDIGGMRYGTFVSPLAKRFRRPPAAADTAHMTSFDDYLATPAAAVPFRPQRVVRPVAPHLLDEAGALPAYAAPPPASALPPPPTFRDEKECKLKMKLHLLQRSMPPPHSRKPHTVR